MKPLGALGQHGWNLTRAKGVQSLAQPLADVLDISSSYQPPPLSPSYYDKGLFLQITSLPLLHRLSLAEGKNPSGFLPKTTQSDDREENLSGGRLPSRCLCNRPKTLSNSWASCYVGFYGRHGYRVRRRSGCFTHLPIIHPTFSRFKALLSKWRCGWNMGKPWEGK